MIAPRAYYNEFDPGAAAWLRELIVQGELPAGDVDERDIRDVRPSDLDGYTQCHFFAGIGGWPLALSLAGWPEDRPVWTGSPPCQPHSAAAADRKRGFDDPRDLWPIWFRNLMLPMRPDIVFGEQVDDSAAWIDRTASDLEDAGFTFGAGDLPALAVNAPVERMRTYFVALSDGAGRGEQGGAVSVAAELMAPERAGRGSFYGQYYTTGELGRTRRIEPGIRPLAHGVSGRVGLLRGYGNAINPWLAAAFIEAVKTFLDQDRPVRLTPGLFD